MSDEEVIKRRLIFDGDGTGDDRRFNLMLKMIAKWVNTSEESREESRQMYDKILAQLNLVEHSRRRSELVTKSNDDQLMKYQELYADYEQKINDIKDEIANQRFELEKAKIIKQNRIQYDLLARAIVAEPPRTEMNKQLVCLQKDLKDLGEEKKRLVQKLDKRKKQFHVLSTSANQLRMYLDEEDEKEDCEINTSLDEVTANSPGPEPMSE
ncbi:THO complex subunit 7 homolog [Anoplophora glabripennis]|uniref:THO complex subunit 7 homolog n=1 Tax=Anoplophora glabripennis TaxID=217634 RepID=UPI0008751853|nr:THO complex subunit 7 homolog [Anoplophora glabripennis]